MVLTPFDQELIANIIAAGKVVSLNRLANLMGAPYRYAYVRSRRLERIGIVSIKRMENMQGRPLAISWMEEETNGTCAGPIG